MRKLYFLLLSLTPLAVKSQKCPDADSIINSRVVNYPNPPGIWPYPYPITWTLSPTCVFTIYPPRIPPVNQDPKTGKKTWYKAGRCSIIYPDKEDSVLLATGQYLNGKKTGKWIWYHESGNKLSEGSYSNGLKTGKWYEWSDNYAYVSIGNFSAGRKEGKWLEYTIPMQEENGEKMLASSVQYHLGLCNGNVFYYFENGRISGSHTYKMGSQHGYSRQYHENGKLSSVSYAVNGKMTGKNISYDEEGKIISVANYFNGLQHGTSTTYDHDYGHQTIETYHKGNLHGWKKVIRDGQLVQKTWYENGKKNGLEFRLSDDQKTIERWKNDELDGTSKTYVKNDSTWILNSVARYRNNLMDSIHYQYNNGNILRTSYKNGKRHGVELHLNSSGDTTKYAEFYNDTLHGHHIAKQNTYTTKGFYNMGKPVSEKTYVNGKLERDIKYRHDIGYDQRFAINNPDGSLLETMYYDDGKSIRTERLFSAQGKGPGTIRTRSYFENGLLNSEQTTQNGNIIGMYIQLDQVGDTIIYSQYNNYKKNKYAMFREGNMIYRGNFVDDTRTGEWKIYYRTDATGKKFPLDSMPLAGTGIMYKSEPFGTWTYYHSNGQLLYRGCICGYPQPVYSAWTNYPSLNSNFYPQNSPINYPLMTFNPVPPNPGFSTGIYCGNYTAYYSDGKVCTRKNKDTTLEYYPNGKLFKHTIGHQFIQYDTSGNIFTAQWKDTIVQRYPTMGDGTIHSSAENKKIKITKIINYKKILTYCDVRDLTGSNPHINSLRTWNDNGILLSFDSSGIWYKYFDDGTLKGAHCADSSVMYYDNRKLKMYYVKGKNDDMYRYYHETGELMIEHKLINKITEGWYKSYYKNGKPAMITFYINGQEHGEHIEYFENGKMMQKRLYDHGIMHGEWTTWNEKGEIISVKRYEKGVEIKAK